MRRDTLLVFNLELDLDSRVLASAHDWVEEFADKYAKVVVYATHVGRTKLPSNVRVVEVGGGSTLMRARAMVRLCGGLIFILRNKQQLRVFHHMSSRTVAILGPIVRLLSVPQILWYSHSKADWSLKLFQSVPNYIVSSSKASVPIINKKKVRGIGHGIKVSRFDSEEKLLSRDRSNMIALGRVVPVKNLEGALEAMINVNREVRENLGEVRLIGPSGLDPLYERKILEIAKMNDLKVDISNSLDYSGIPDLLASSSILFSGTPISVDKVCLEAAMSGCFIISENLNVLELTGLDAIYPTVEIRESFSLQLEWLSGLTPEEEVQVRRRIIRRSRTLNSLISLVESIEKIYEEIETSEDSRFLQNPNSG